MKQLLVKLLEQTPPLSEADDIVCRVPYDLLRAFGEDSIRDVLDVVVRGPAEIQEKALHVLDRIIFEADGPPLEIVSAVQQLVATNQLPHQTICECISACLINVSIWRDGLDDLLLSLAGEVMRNSAFRKDNRLLRTATKCRERMSKKRAAVALFNNGSIVLPDAIITDFVDRDKASPYPLGVALLPTDKLRRTIVDTWAIGLRMPDRKSPLPNTFRCTVQMRSIVKSMTRLVDTFWHKESTDNVCLLEIKQSVSSPRIGERQ